MKRFGIICLCLIYLFLFGCKEYCPAFSPDETAYLPVDYVGQTLRYLIDGDTVAFIVQPPQFSEKYEKSIADIEYCAEATLVLSSANAQSVMRYHKTCNCDNASVWQMCLSVKHKDLQLSFVGPSFHMNTNQFDANPILPTWVSPTGETYVDVCNMPDAITPNDTAYFLSTYGLLSFQTDGQHYCLLLP